MRIGLVCPYTWDVPGGVQEHIRGLADALIEMGHYVSVIAPAAEETIFRGYIYAVLKRNIGAVGAALLSAALFGAMHMNLGALPALFVLSLCLTLAYEATGSLLVNIFMHAFFNLSMLLAMLSLARHSQP